MQRRSNGKISLGTALRQSTLKKIEDLVRRKYPDLREDSFAFKTHKGHIIDDVVTWYKAERKRNVKALVADHKTHQYEVGDLKINTAYSVEPRTRRTLEAFKALHGLPMQAILEAVVVRYYALVTEGATEVNEPDVIEEFNGTREPTPPLYTPPESSPIEPSTDPKTPQSGANRFAVVDSMFAYLGGEVLKGQENVKKTKARVGFYSYLVNNLTKLERQIAFLTEEVGQLKESRPQLPSEAQRAFQEDMEGRLSEFSDSIHEELETVLTWAAERNK